MLPNQNSLPSRNPTYWLSCFQRWKKSVAAISVGWKNLLMVTGSLRVMFFRAPPYLDRWVAQIRPQTLPLVTPICTGRSENSKSSSIKTEQIRVLNMKSITKIGAVPQPISCVDSMVFPLETTLLGRTGCCLHVPGYLTLSFRMSAALPELDVEQRGL